MTISTLTVETVANFLRLDEPNDIELAELEMLMASTLTYIMQYTGRSEDYVKSQEDLTYVYLAMINDMFEQRQFQMDKGRTLNETLLSILNLHSVNLLPGEGDLFKGSDADA